MTLSPPYGAPYDPPTTSRPQAPTVAVALAVLAAALAVDLALTLVTGFAGRRGQVLPWGVQGVLFPLIGFGAFGLALVLVGRDLRHRLLALVPVAAAALVAVGVTTWFFAFDAMSAGPGLVEGVFATHAYLVSVLIAASWGIARRTGSWWTAGLLVVPALVWLTRQLSDDYLRLLWEVLPQSQGPSVGFDRTLFDAAWWAYSTAPMLAGLLACWFVETMTKARHPRG